MWGVHLPAPPVLSSTAWHSLSLEMLWVYHSPPPNALIWSGESTVPAGVFFVLRGGVRILIDGRETHCPAGTAFFSAPSVRRQFFEERTILLSVGFRAEWPQPKPLFLDGLNCAVPTADIAPLKPATEKLYRAAHGTRKSVTFKEAIVPPALPLDERCLLEAAFLRWFAEYARTVVHLGVEPAPQSLAKDPRVLVAKQRLDEWPGDAPFHRATFMHGLQVGERRLEQIFREELGVTPYAYLERRKLELARHRLAYAPQSLKEIAYGLGFRHASHFTIWFRRLAGETPTEFRERSRIEGL